MRGARAETRAAVRPFLTALLGLVLLTVLSCGDDPAEPADDQLQPPSVEVLNAFQTSPSPATVHVAVRVTAGSRPLDPQGMWTVADGPQGTFPVPGEGVVEFDVQGLTPGEYDLTVQVRDQDGAPATGGTDFEVVLTLRSLDMDVGWISRSSPRIPFRKHYAQSTPDEGWPAPGQDVIWSARVINWTDAALNGVDYEWLLDGREVADGFVNLPAEGTLDVDLTLPWADRRQELTFRLDTEDAYDEVEEANNEVTIHTDALAVGFRIERGIYERFRRNQREFGRGTNSFEDWARYKIRSWNEIFARSVDPELAPDGVLDRLRLDYVEVWEDGTVWSSGWWWGDPEVDMRYAFPTDDMDSPYQFLRPGSPRQSFDPENLIPTNSYLHEMLHQRYLMDIYALELRHDGDRRRILVTEGDEPVAGSEHMPFINALGTVYRYGDRGVMGGGEYSRLTLHSTVAMNLVAGRRAHWDPDNTTGSTYLLDIPEENRLVVTDEAGTPLSGAGVRVYQDTAFNYYGEHYDDEPDLVLTADQAGSVLLGAQPFGSVLYERPPKPVVAIVRVEHQGLVGYGFLPIADFNLEYWRGRETVGEYELAVTLREP